MAFKFIPHTGDIKIQVKAKTIEEAFKDSALALKKSIKEENDIQETKRIKIKIKAQDNKSLLYNFLEEFLFLLDTKNFLLSNVEKIKINLNKNKLTAIIKGDKASNYDFSNEVKAITYSDMKIQNNNKGYKLEFILDV